MFGHRARKLSNVKLTRQFHWRYMGLWVVLTISLCVLFSAICYGLVEAPMADIYTLNQAELDAYLRERNLFIIGLLLEVVVVSTCVIMLAVFTAHRTAGPYLRIIAGCNALAEGDDEYRLKFRDYDRLEEVEVAFNAMLDKLRADIAAGRSTLADSANDPPSG